MSKDEQAMAVAMMYPVTLARASTGKPASCRMFFGPASLLVPVAAGPAVQSRTHNPARSHD
jgi:hypothetical protein